MNSIVVFVIMSAALVLSLAVETEAQSVPAPIRDSSPVQGIVLYTQSQVPGGAGTLLYPPVTGPGDTPVPVTTTIHLEPVVVPAYPYESHLHDTYSALYNMTFRRLNWFSYDRSEKTLVDVTFTGVVMENQYLKLTVLPELGGRIYECIFKPTGHNEFYQNPVLKPTRWGPPEQGWWLAAGGLEWCLPVEEHGYETGLPWQYVTLQSSEGVTVTVRDSAGDDRLRAQIDIHLPSGKAYFSVSPRLENTAESALPCKFWLNAMLAPGGTNNPSDQSQFIYPTDRMTVHSRDGRWTGLPGPGLGFTWPFQDGRDLSRLENWPYYLGCFERPVATGDFVALYDHDVEEGIVRVFPSEIARGAKAFSFGYGDGALPSSLWTDDSSSYLEIHGGVAPTFDDCVVLEPGEQLTWTEYWYPIKDIGGVVAATEEAALNLDLTPEGVQIGLATTARYEQGTLVLKNREDDSWLLQETISLITPALPYLHEYSPATGLNIEELSLTYTTSNGVRIVSYD